MPYCPYRACWQRYFFIGIAVVVSIFLIKLILENRHKGEAIAYSLIALSIRHVCEFGTGNGKFLQLLRERLGPELSYTGIDICVEQVEANRNVYTGLEFVAADACEWLDQNIRDNTLYLTFGGVLE